MSESDLQGPQNEAPKLARAFTLIALLETQSQRKVRLPRVDGLTKVGRSLFRYEFDYVKLLSEISLPKHLAFRKGRSVPPIRSKRTPPEKRTYTIVSYRFRTPTAQQKKKVQRLRLRSPHAQLRPGLLLFPHFRTSDGKKLFSVSSKRPPLSSKDFAAQLSSMGADVNRWARMRPLTAQSTLIVEAAIKQTVERHLHSLEKRVLSLRDAVKREEIPVGKMKERYSETRRLYEDLRTTLLITKKVWSIDSDTHLKRIYNLLLRIRKGIRALSELA